MQFFANNDNEFFANDFVCVLYRNSEVNFIWSLQILKFMFNTHSERIYKTISKYKA